MDILISEVEREDDWVVHPIVVAKYPKDDLIGLFHGYYSLIVYEIHAVYITLFLWNRDMLTFYCCFTHLISEIINVFLKQFFKQPRPENGAPRGGLFEGRYGMPSQHCHCFAYLVTTVTLLTLHYYRTHVNSSKKFVTVLLGSASLALQILGRIYLKFHTVEQCLAGTVLGVTSAIIFYTLGQMFFMPHAEWMCTLSPLRLFSFRKDLLTPTPTSSKSNQLQLRKKKLKSC